MLDDSASAFERVGVDLKDVEVLSEAVGGDEEAAARVELERVDGLLVGEKVGDYPRLVLVVEDVGLAGVADVLFGVYDCADARLEVVFALVAVLGGGGAARAVIAT